jgi:hypothetical protein
MEASGSTCWSATLPLVRRCRDSTAIAQLEAVVRPLSLFSADGAARAKYLPEFFSNTRGRNYCHWTIFHVVDVPQFDAGEGVAAANESLAL